MLVLACGRLLSFFARCVGPWAFLRVSYRPRCGLLSSLASATPGICNNRCWTQARGPWPSAGLGQGLDAGAWANPDGIAHLVPIVGSRSGRPIE